MKIKLNSLRGQLLGCVLLLMILAACSPGGETAVSSNNQTNASNTADSVAIDPDVAQHERFPADKYADYELVTLLPRDAIPAIDNPQFLSASEADGFYDPDELIIGVEFNGDARAYSVPFLSSHEIVNDTVGGEIIAVTW